MSDQPAHLPDPPSADRSPRVPRYETPSVRAVHEQRSRHLLLRVVRLLFFVLLVSVTVLTLFSKTGTEQEFNIGTITGPIVAAVAVWIIVVFVDMAMPNKRLSMVVAVYLGLCAGLIGALAVGTLMDGVARAWGLDDPEKAGQAQTYVGLAKVIIGIVLCYLGVSVVLTTKDDFRLVIPYVEFAKQVRGVRPMLLDSSVLIDGRIEDLGQTGFIDAPLIVPQFVIDEMQMLADSGDRLKRERGRRGLSMVARLQNSAFVDVSIDTTTVDARSVDHMLLDLAFKQNLRVLTNDYNLNKVAQIQGVTVLNINDLANSLKAQVVPGQPLTVQLIKPGEAPTQGVGYLPDGTMVVVENGSRHIGDLVTIMVTNSLQTSAGRMIFGRVEGDEEPDGESSNAEALARAATQQPRATVRPGHREESPPGRNPRR